MIRRVFLVLLASLLGAAPGAFAEACPAIARKDELLVAGGVVLLGEMHGTEESPAFLADLACGAGEAGLAVRVGLEVDVAEAGAIEWFLDSGGTAEDVELLLAGPFWTRDYQDGRSSRAMAALLADLGALRRSGRPVTVFPFSHETAGADRDAAMAEVIAGHLAGGDEAVTLVLTGNLHSRTRVGSPWDPAFEPMGYRLAALLPERRIVSLDVCHGGGSAWICTGGSAADCGERRLGPSRAQGPAGIHVGSGAEAEGHDGAYCVDALHASPPARDRSGAGEH